MTDRTNAERQRRYIARLKAQAVKTGVTNAPARATPEKELAQSKAELARARARIAELEKALASAKRDTIQRSGAQQQLWHKPSSAAEKSIMQLEAKVRELESLVLPLDDEGKTAVGQHRRKVDREFKAWCKQTEAMFKARIVTMHNRDYSLFLAGFHPDASPEMRDKARNRFEKLYKRIVITDSDKIKWPPL